MHVYYVCTLYMYIVKMTLSLLLYRIDLVDVARTTHKWLASTTTSIDSEDAKLVEEVRLRTRHRLMPSCASFMLYELFVKLALWKMCLMSSFIAIQWWDIHLISVLIIRVMTREYSQWLFFLLVHVVIIRFAGFTQGSLETRTYKRVHYDIRSRTWHVQCTCKLRIAKTPKSAWQHYVYT